MTVLAPQLLPRPPKSSNHAHPRLGAVVITLGVGALALLSMAAAWLQADSEPPSLTPARAAVPVSAYPSPQAERWIGVVPNAPDEVQPPASTF